VALMGMWMRSYSHHDYLRVAPLGSRYLVFSSIYGRLLVAESDYNTATDSLWKMGTIKFGPDLPVLESGRLGFLTLTSPGGSGVAVPFWFVVLSGGSLAMLFQVRWPPRFNLRHLFIPTTFLAIVLGMIAWLDRAWIGK
jgi:hypothetical protein